MTPGKIWEKIQQLQVFTFNQLVEELLEGIEQKEVYRAILKGKVNYMLARALQEGLLVKKGRKYFLPEKLQEEEEIKKKVKALPEDVIAEILNHIHFILYKT